MSMADPHSEGDVGGVEAAGGTCTPVLDDIDLPDGAAPAPESGSRSGTPTMDDHPNGLATCMTGSSSLHALTQHAMDEIPLPTASAADAHQTQPDVDGDPRDTPVEDENPEPQGKDLTGALVADNLSEVSNNSLLELRNEKGDDFSSLSDMDDTDADGKKLDSYRLDLEDGEVLSGRKGMKKGRPNVATSRSNSPAGSPGGGGRRQSASPDGGGARQRSGSSGGGRRRRRSSSGSRQRKNSRGRGSFERSSSRGQGRDSSSFDDGGGGRRRRRPSSDGGGGGGVGVGGSRRGDLPRYDVRNIIERNKKKSSRSPSPKRRHSSGASDKGASKKSKKSRNKRRVSRSRSRSPYVSPRKRRMSRSRTPPSIGRKQRRRSSRSPSPSRGFRGRYSRSRSPSPSSNNYGGSSGRWSPGLRYRLEASPPPPRDLMVVRDKSPVGGGKKSKKNREDKGNKKGKSDKTKKTNQNRERSPFDVIEVNTANSDGGGKSSKKKKDKGSKKQKNKNGAAGSNDGGKSKKKRRQQQGSNDNDPPSSAAAVVPPLSSSVITEKEVFAAGDKIMVSVNFRKNSPPPVYNPPSAAEIAARTKPSAIIDITLEDEPPQVIEKTEEIVDIYSEDEDGGGAKKKSNGGVEGVGTNDVTTVSSVVNGVVVSTSVVGNSSGGTGLGGSGVSTGPSAAVAQILSQAAARADSRAITSPPQENFDLSRGPQTPTEDPDNSYDPCDPTESPELDNGHDDGLLDDDDDDDDGGVFNGLLTKEQNGNKKSMGGVNSNGLSNNSSIPFLHDGAGGGTNGDVGGGDDGNDLGPVDMDMDMDSPFSPQSSELSDIFEPPSALNTPLTNKKLAAKRPMVQNSFDKLKSTNLRQKTKAAAPGKPSKNKHIHMKIIDDQLRIIDEVPTSAVEMQVKEKFLKKVQRQERAVEEIKMVLKPLYNRKRISKEHYKEILRKCVPKVCHSKKGDINPMKIQKLVKGYVKKYNHGQKR